MTRMDSEQKYLVLGLMSGTSLDGLDLALSEFSIQNGRWNFNLIDCKTLAYNKSWLEKLKHAHNSSKKELVKLHVDYGNFMGEVS